MAYQKKAQKTSAALGESSGSKGPTGAPPLDSGPPLPGIGQIRPPPGAPAQASGAPTHTSEGQNMARMQAFISANQGNAGKLANAVAGQVGNIGYNAQLANANAQASGFGLNPYGNSWVGKIDPTTGQPVTPPPLSTQQQQQMAAGAGYYGQAANASTQAANAAGALGSNEGRQALLQQQFAGKPYTQGSSALDSYLLGSSPAAQRTLGAQQQRFGGIRGQLQNSYQSAQDAINAKYAPKAQPPPPGPAPTPGPIPSIGTGDNGSGGPAPKNPKGPPPPPPAGGYTDTGTDTSGASDVYSVGAKPKRSKFAQTWGSLNQSY